MRLPASLLLSLLIGAVQAASETAEVYIFQKPELQSSITIPTLTPVEASLIIAQRLGVSQYHNLHHANGDTLEYINAFGGRQSALFANDGQEDGRSQLVVMVQGVTGKVAQPLLELLGSNKPAFKISNPPSKAANAQFIEDITAQNSVAAQTRKCSFQDDVNPFEEKCWAGRSKILHFDARDSPIGLSELVEATSRMLRYVQNEAMDVMMVILPESTRHSPNLWGSYDKPARPHKRQLEEPMKLSDISPVHASDKTRLPKSLPKGTFATCHSSNESCVTATNNCSGHGHCYAKYMSNSTGSCYTCKCMDSVNFTETEDGRKLERLTHWGGAACSKQDVSSQFWLLAGFSVVLVGLVSWIIGMMFSIGQEKLPSVIGAGVSASKGK